MKRLICGLIGHDWRWAPMRRYYSVNLEGTDWVALGIAQIATCARCRVESRQQYRQLMNVADGGVFVGVPKE